MLTRSLAAALLLATGLVPAHAAKTSLVVSLPIEPPGLDPTIAAPVAIREVTWVNLFEGLVRLDSEGRVQPLSRHGVVVDDEDTDGTLLPGLRLGIGRQRVLLRIVP